MSENVVIIITTTLGPIILALIGLRAIRLNQKVVVHKLDDTANKIDATANKVEDNTKITNEVKSELTVVKSQTDGMKTELVEVTGLYREALGKAAGKAEQRIETEAAAHDAAVKVEIINGSSQVVNPKEEKNGNEGGSKS